MADSTGQGDRAEVARREGGDTPTATMIQVPAVPLTARFEFDGGAATYLGTGIAGFLVTVATLGICGPWAICMVYRWRARHTIVDGHRLRFTGSAPGLFGQWIVWLLLMVVTFGVYGFWVVPRLTRWTVQHQEFDTRPLRRA